MKTIKPITTITYNTDKFLNLKLKELIKAGKIDFYFYVRHYGEEERLPNGKKKKDKDHIHLYIRPACRFEMSDLPELLKEKDPNNPEKPLTCLPCNKCNSDYDAYMYFIHDKGYLISKGMTRQHFYSYDDVVTSSPEYLDEMIHTFPVSPFQREEALYNAVLEGATDSEILKARILPMGDFYRYRLAIQCIRNGANARLSPDPVEEINEEDVQAIINSGRDKEKETQDQNFQKRKRYAIKKSLERIDDKTPTPFD